MRDRGEDGTRALLAIHRLQAAYGDAVTRRAWEEVRELFLPDAVVRIDTRTRDPFEVHGPDALVQFIATSLESFAFFEFTILNAVAELDGDDDAAGASGRVYTCELRCDGAGEWTEAYGLYQDRYQRVDGDWRIASRQYHSLARRGQEVATFPLPPSVTP